MLYPISSKMVEIKLTYKRKSSEPGMDYEFIERIITVDEFEYECLKSCIGNKVIVKDNGNFWNTTLSRVEKIKYEKRKDQLF